MAYKDFGGDILISDQLKSKILLEISPTSKQQNVLNELVEEFNSLLQSSIESLGYDIDLYVGGSFGKNTYLKHSFDVDIFCRCSMEYENSSLSTMVEEILKKTNIDFHREKGSRDYFSGEYSNHGTSIKFELVPTRRIELLSQACNSTDYSYLHVEYIKEQSKKNPDLQQEIRLTKALFKAKEWYGAESYIGGFSGHVVDLLLCYYGSLDNLLHGAKQWDFNQIIDVANHFSSSKIALASIDTSKHSSLIVVDSILPQRNAARALSQQVFGEFLVWVHTHDKLVYEDFVRQIPSLDEELVSQKTFAKEKGLTLVHANLDLKLVPSQDIAGAKLKKLYEKISTYFSKLGFEVMTSSFIIDSSFLKASFFYHISYTQLPKYYLLRGPPVTMGDAIKKVISKEISYEINGKHVYYYVKREFTHLDEVVSLTLNQCRDMMSTDISFITTFKMKKYS